MKYELKVIVTYTNLGLDIMQEIMCMLYCLIQFSIDNRYQQFFSRSIIEYNNDNAKKKLSLIFTLKIYLSSLFLSEGIFFLPCLSDYNQYLVNDVMELTPPSIWCRHMKHYIDYNKINCKWYQTLLLTLGTRLGIARPWSKMTCMHLKLA